jgi:AGZA family xanthine/uracil permease-like MFS transporter
VGAMMATQLGKINWNNLAIVIPSFITIITMPLTYSIATGIALGFILFPISMIAMKKTREVHPIMYVLCVTFIGYFVFVV